MLGILCVGQAAKEDMCGRCSCVELDGTVVLWLTEGWAPKSLKPLSSAFQTASTIL